MSVKFILPTICALWSILFLGASVMAKPEPPFPIAQAPAPLFDDSVWHGAADPTVIWNGERGEWRIYYTQRRATLNPVNDVDWVHGTAIGIAGSPDGIHWKYEGICKGDDGLGDPIGHNCTWWAPAVYELGGVYHMFLAKVHGIPAHYGGVATIEHFTSRDGLTWTEQPHVALSSGRVIDPCLAKIGGAYYLWYKDEVHGSHTWMARSDDLTHWTVMGEVVNDVPHEAPLVWAWKQQYWMAVDVGAGLRIYGSPNGMAPWTFNTMILTQPGIRDRDNWVGGHPFILVQGDRAFVFYHVHYRPDNPVYDTRRTVLQVAELGLDAQGHITCDRNRYAAKAAVQPTH